MMRMFFYRFYLLLDMAKVRFFFNQTNIFDIFFMAMLTFFFPNAGFVFPMLRAAASSGIRRLWASGMARG